MEDALVADDGAACLNQRYSPLKEISTGNVKQLKGVWLTHLRNSAVAAKYSADGEWYRARVEKPLGPLHAGGLSDLHRACAQVSLEQPGQMP